jgi:hypothetical protein
VKSLLLDILPRSGCKAFQVVKIWKALRYGKTTHASKRL